MKASTWFNNSYADATSPGTEGVLMLRPKFQAREPRGGVLFVHGAGSLATYCMDAYGSQGLLTDQVVQEGYNALSGDNAGTQTWGNYESITRIGSNLSLLFGMGNVDPGRYALISGSMGGLNSINFAAQARVKPAAIVSVIPVIHMEDILVNNRAGYAPFINAAYPGGAYDAARDGADHNPWTMRSANKIKGIPHLLFYGTQDTLCLPQWTEGYIAADPANRTGVPVPYGHEASAYDAVDHQMVIDFLNTHLG